MLSSSRQKAMLATALCTILLLPGCSVLQKTKDVVSKPFSFFGNKEAAPEVTLPAGVTLSSNAMRDYQSSYAADPRNKAFAASSSGAFGVAFGATTASEAERAALAKCNEDVAPGESLCQVYDINGQRVSR